MPRHGSTRADIGSWTEGMLLNRARILPPKVLLPNSGKMMKRITFIFLIENQFWHYTLKKIKPIAPHTANYTFSSAQSLSRVWLFVTPWTAARQASLSITNSRSLLKLMSIELVMPSNHLILSRPLLLPPTIFPSIRVFSNESVNYTLVSWEMEVWFRCFKVWLMIG